MAVPPPKEPTAGGPAKGVRLRNAAFRSALMAVAVVVSGYELVMTRPLMVGGMPAQRPNPPALSTVTALQVWSGVNTTSPLIWVIGAVMVLVTPAVAAMANGFASPRLMTIAGPTLP